MTCLGVLERGERGDGYETYLKEGGVLEMSTRGRSFRNVNYTVFERGRSHRNVNYSAPFAMLAPSLCEYLPNC